MPLQRALSRSLLAMLMLLPLDPASAAGPARRTDNRATDAAFAALLSMPSAKPEHGSWSFPPRDDFKPSGEANLIADLARQQKAGADVNAYRHQGTLLHHAIRAGLDQTAAWLLAHGADPRLPETDSGQDALALAVSRKRPAVAALLRKQVAGKPAPQATAAAAPPAPPTTPQIAPRSYAIKSVMDNAANPGALRALPQSMFDDYGADVLGSLAEAGSIKSDPKTGAIIYTVPADAWRVLWQRLKRPLDYSALTGLAGKMDPALWPELYASGYPHTTSAPALGCLLAEVDAPRLRALWPVLVARFPDLRQDAPRQLLGDYLLRTESSCADGDPERLQAKLAFLKAQGARTPVPGLLAASFQEAPPALRDILATWVPAPGSVHPRLVAAAPSCRFVLTDAWYTALTGPTTWPIESVQTLDMPGPTPGATQCALLVGGSEFQAGGGDLVDGFDGPETEPRASCPDPSDAYEVWYEQNGQIRKRETDAGHDWSVSGLVLVSDRVTGQRYYLSDGLQAGRCHLSSPRVPQLFAWRPQGLMRVAVPALEQDLLAQCESAEGAIGCAGIPKISPDPQPLKSLTGTRDAARQKAWLDAVLALDKGRLKAMRATAPHSWTGDAIKAVSAADMPLEEKRRRIAWLFVDRKALTESFGLGWAETLLPWLPYQDWRPVIEAAAAIDGHGHYLEALTEAARNAGQERIACDIDNARGFLCGETIGSE